MSTPKKELHTLIIGAGKLSHLGTLFEKLIGNRNFRVNHRAGLEEGTFFHISVPVHDPFPPRTLTAFHAQFS